MSGHNLQGSIYGGESIEGKGKMLDSNERCIVQGLGTN